MNPPHTCAIRTDATLWCWGWNNNQLGIGKTDLDPHSDPIQVGTATNWRVVDAGWNKTSASRG